MSLKENNDGLKRQHVDRHLIWDVSITERQALTIHKGYNN